MLVTLLSVVNPLDSIMTCGQVDMVVHPRHTFSILGRVDLHASEAGIACSVLELHLIGVCSHMDGKSWVDLVGWLQSCVLVPVLRHGRLDPNLFLGSEEMLLVVPHLSGSLSL